MPLSATPTNLESTSKITGIIESVLKDIALIVGGLFAYWKFFMGRTFQPRLEPSISASARVEENQTSLCVVCKLKNVGLSRVDLDREASVLRLYLQTVVLKPNTVVELQWSDSPDKAVDVFHKHQWIEGGETIEDAHLFVFPYVPNQACRIELGVIRARRTQTLFGKCKRRRKGANAWWQHVILDRFTIQPTNNATESRTEHDEKATSQSEQS